MPAVSVWYIQPRRCFKVGGVRIFASGLPHWAMGTRGFTDKRPMHLLPRLWRWVVRITL
jgi:hypothetical protein